MNVGTLEVELLANIARLRQDMSDATGMVDRATQQMSKAAEFAKGALIGMAGGLSVAAFVSWTKGVIDGTGALHDMAIQTGNSAAALAQFRSIGTYTETTIDAVAAASLKLSKNMALADEEGKGAALALKALGIDFDTFRKMDPDQRMLAVAKSMNEYKDGADKSAAAMLLFGKEGAKMLPFLKDLGEQSEQVSGKLSEQEKALRANQAAMADAFGDNLTAIRKNSEGWKKDMAMGLLPALYETSEALKAMNEGTGGIKARISELAQDGTLAEWARMGATAISYLVDIGQGLLSLFPMIGKAIAGVAAGSVELFTGTASAIKQFVEGDYSKSMETMKGAFRAVGTIGQATASDISAVWNQKLIGQTFRETMASLKGVSAQSDDTRKSLGNLAETQAKREAAEKAAAAAAKQAVAEEKKQADELQRLRAEVDQYTGKLLLEQQQTEKLTDGQKLSLKALEALRDGRIKGTEADRQALAQKLELMFAEERDAELARRGKEQTEAFTKARNEAVGAMAQQTATLESQVRQQEEENLKLTLSAEAWEGVEIARIRAAAAARTASADFLEEHGQIGAETEELRKQAEALSRLAELKEQGIHVKAARDSADEWKKTTEQINSGLTDALMRAFESGKGFADAFKSVLINAFKTLILQPLIKPMIEPMGSIVAPIMGDIGKSLSGALFGNVGSIGAGGFSIPGLGIDFGGGFNPAGTGIASTVGGWMQSAGNWMTGGLGNLSNSPLAGIGGWLSSTGNALGSASGLGISGGGMLGALAGLGQMAQGKWGAGLGTSIGSIFGGPIGGFLGSTVGGWVDSLFGGDGKDFHGADYMASSQTGGYRPREREVGDRQYGFSIQGGRSNEIEASLKSITDASVGMLGALQAVSGGSSDFRLGTFFNANGDASQGNLKLLRDGQTLASKSVGNYGADAAGAFKAYTADVASAVRSAMGQVDLPSWAKKQLDQLGSGATLDQMAQVVSTITATKNALANFGAVFEPLGGAFGTISKLSDEAKVSLVNMAGGLDALAVKSSSFVKNYYSDKEQAGMAANQISTALRAVGVDPALITTKDDFRAALETAATKTETEAGQKAFVALLNASQTFSDISKILVDNQMNLGGAAAWAPGTPAALLMQSQIDKQSAQVEASQAAVTGINQVNNSVQAMIGVVNAGLQLVANKVDGLASVSNQQGRSLVDAITDVLSGLSRPQP